MARDHTSWRKSRPSEPNGHCVEVARAADGVGVRDSKGPGPSSPSPAKRGRTCWEHSGRHPDPALAWARA
ncbi:MULTISPECIES: DUF397 domain-containing protein [Actinomadura]|uniref:DUF397 domain-containing protein n=1 Tax=Actinomadura yumaensis TaxID=111807 RepID=A0ABW2CK10_9ACTN|nr:DUF397 domain-containing protein [Actinomadura sp. J1-007]MWK38689.1 DUF397 domain-containing protein [Actinomadura sp. J1-007]